MNLKSLDNKSLHKNTIELAKDERELTAKVLHHLREIERRSLFAELGYSSLFEYCVQELKYSEGAAQRRISSMRLLRDIPEKEKMKIEEKVEKGILSLSTLSQAQIFFRHEKLDTKSKIEILGELENKSRREVERELVKRASHPERLMAEKIRVVTETHTELKVLVDEKVLKQIEELKNLIANKCPNASLKETLEYALTKALEATRPKAPKEKSLPPPAAVKSRFIPVEVKRQVWARDKGQCTYLNKESGKECSCKYSLEYDHIKPFAMGGSNTVENLRLRCRSHNQLAAIQTYGQKKMQNYVPNLR